MIRKILRWMRVVDEKEAAVLMRLLADNVCGYVLLLCRITAFLVKE